MGTTGMVPTGMILTDHLCCQNIVAAEVITAAGKIVVVNVRFILKMMKYFIKTLSFALKMMENEGVVRRGSILRATRRWRWDVCDR